jgi:hypothetical protein
MRYVDIRFTLVPVLFILVIPVLIIAPLLYQHQQHLLSGLGNDTLLAILFGAANASTAGAALRCDYSK